MNTYNATEIEVLQKLKTMIEARFLGVHVDFHPGPAADALDDVFRTVTVYNVPAEQMLEIEDAAYDTLIEVRGEFDLTVSFRLKSVRESAQQSEDTFASHWNHCQELFEHFQLLADSVQTMGEAGVTIRHRLIVPKSPDLAAPLVDEADGYGDYALAA